LGRREANPRAFPNPRVGVRYFGAASEVIGCGRIASAVPWMKATILVPSSFVSLLVKSGMPLSLNGPLNTMSLRLALETDDLGRIEFVRAIDATRLHHTFERVMQRPWCESHRARVSPAHECSVNERSTNRVRLTTIHQD
jgi:hypothetical protein